MINGVLLRGNIAYCLGISGFYVVDLSKPDQPVVASTVTSANPVGICKDSNWAYYGSSTSNGVWPVDVTDPYSIITYNPRIIERIGAN